MLPMLKRSMPSLVDEFFGRNLLDSVFDFNTGVSTPSVNIVEGKDSFRIEVAAPGLSKEDFKIDLNNNVLTISSEKEEKKEEKDEQYMRREFSYTSFTRSFTLPLTADTEKISANHKDGVLTIAIPKKDEAKEKPKRTINIS